MNTPIYVCFTLYHLYVSLLKSFFEFKKENKKSYIVITDHIDNYEQLIKLIKEANFEFIQDVIFIPDKKNIKFTKKDKFLYILNYKKYILKMYESYDSLFKGKEIYVFLDITNISRYLMIKFKSINLIEDGIGIYREYKISLKDIIKNILGIPLGWGRSKYIKNIYVNFPDKVSKSIKLKTKELRLNEFEDFASLNKEFVNKLLFIFKLDSHQLQLKSPSKKVLILTQPFSESNFISEKEKKSMYEKIVKEYKNKGFEVFLKVHPREKTNYDFNEKVYIFPKDFPIELINFLDNYISFDKIVSVNSSSIFSIRQGKKIMLGLSINKKLQLKYNRHLQLKKSNDY